MFDAGIWEIGLILLLSLVIVGPKRLPEVASKLGEWTAKFRKLQSSFHHIYSHYSDYPNAGKHMLGLDSKSKGANQFEAIKQEFDEIKKEIDEPINLIDANDDKEVDLKNKSTNSKKTKP